MTSPAKLAADPRVKEILEVISQLASGNPEAQGTPSGLGDDLDSIIEKLNVLAEGSAYKDVLNTEAKKRLDELVDVMVDFASLDFSNKASVTDKGDNFDAIATGLNALGEELFASSTSKEYLNSIISSMNETLIVLNTDKTINTSNQAVQDLLGYTEAELIGKPVDIIFTLNKLMGPMRNTEISYRAKDGRRIPMLLSVSIMRNEYARVKGFLCVARDITERKRAEEEMWKFYERLEEMVGERTAELKKTNVQLKKEIRDRIQAEEELRKFKTIADMANYGIAIADLSGKLEYINEYFAAVHGYKPEELLGENLYIFHNDKQVEEVSRINQGWRDEGSFSAEQVWHMHREGSVFPMLMKGVIIKSEQGAPLFMACIALDITEQVRAKEALRRSEEWMELALKGAALGAWDWNVQTGEVRFNKRWAEMLGYTLDEIEPHVRSWEKLLHPDDMSGVRKVLNAHLEGHTPFYETEHRVRSKSGEWIWILDRGKVLERNSEGKPVRAAGTHLDITERKNAEAKLQESLEEKEVLLREIHHRVKNNLQVVSSVLNLQSSYIKDKQAAEQLMESRNRIYSMAFIHESLYQSRNFVQVSLAVYIRNLASNLFQSYGVDLKAIKLKINADEIFLDIDQTVHCGLIINELVSNALKYAFKDRKKGEIQIDFHEQDDDQLVMVVSDNGVGLPMEMNGGMDKTLGLRLVNILVKQLDAEIEIDNSSGTAFRIVFRKREMVAEIGDDKIRGKHEQESSDY